MLGKRKPYSLEVFEYEQRIKNNITSKFEKLDDIPDLPKSGILSGYDENGNAQENLHIQGFYNKYNKNANLCVPDYAEKQLEHYEKTYNPETKRGDLYYDGL